jgi:hypothetical protein
MYGLRSRPATNRRPTAGQPAFARCSRRTHTPYEPESSAWRAPNVGLGAPKPRARPFDAASALLRTPRPGRCAARSNPVRLAKHPALHRVAEATLWAHWSPDQIAQWLRRPCSTDLDMRVSDETIYRSLFVQERGATLSGTICARGADAPAAHGAVAHRMGTAAGSGADQRSVS